MQDLKYQVLQDSSHNLKEWKVRGNRQLSLQLGVIIIWLQEILDIVSSGYIITIITWIKIVHN